MRKLALVAAALMPLLGGCVASTCDLPTVTIHWQLQDTNGTGLTCTQRGVAFVDVYIGSTQPVRFNCADYAGVIDVSRVGVGTYSTTVEGIASDETILDRARPFSVSVGDCGDQPYYPVLGEGLLNIDYHFAPVDACHGGSMWFALRDETTGQDISVVDAATPVVPPDYTVWQTYYGCYACDTSVPPVCQGRALRFPVPFGPYTLRGIQEVVNPLTAPVSAYEMCTPSSFTVNAPGTTFTPPDLLQTLPGAPACF
jgi:hypothetical protein